MKRSDHTPTKPSAARGIFLIVKREFGQYFGTQSGYIISALTLFLSGLFFHAFALGKGAKFSSDVLSDYFYYSSGTTIAAGVFFAMRLIAEERQTGTLALLSTSSLSEGQIILAKFLSAFLVLSMLILVTAYMPLLVFVNGQVSIGHILAGYLGLLLIGAASVSIGLFGSSLVKSQLVALMISGVITVVMLLLWMTSRIVDGRLGDLIAHFALHDKHFRPFMEGTVTVSNIVYYLSVCVLFLVMARNGLEARRWKP